MIKIFLKNKISFFILIVVLSFCCYLTIAPKNLLASDTFSEELILEKKIKPLEEPSTKADNIPSYSLTRFSLLPPLLLNHKINVYKTKPDFYKDDKFILKESVSTDIDRKSKKHELAEAYIDLDLKEEITDEHIITDDDKEDDLDFSILAKHSLTPPFLLLPFNKSFIPLSESSAYQPVQRKQKLLTIFGPKEIEEDSYGKGHSPTVNLTMELQTDFAFFRQDETNKEMVGEIPDGAFFRRARFGIFGELYETIEYRTEFDFAGEARPRFLDNWIAFTDIPFLNNIIIGHFFEPFSLERYTPNRFITFNERSLADNFAPARNMGAMIYGNYFKQRLTWAMGLFRSNSDDFGDDVSFQSGYAGTFHSTFLPWFIEDNEYSRRLLHLGGSFSYRTPGDDPVRFASRPSVRMRQQDVAGVPNFVDTGNIEDATNYILYGAEAAWVHGPLSLQAEVIDVQVNIKNDINPKFRSGYLYGSIFLTGESRSYSPTSVLGRFREGIFQRIKPYTNFLDKTSGNIWSGLGAIELAARWAFIDLNDGPIRGGYLQEMTYGLNWHLNPYTKVMFNYVRPVVTSSADRNLKSNADMFTVRFQFEY